MTKIFNPKRFWSKVDIHGEDECWPWTAGKDRKGYGHFSINGILYGAHKIAWELTNNETSKGKVIRHTCNNPPCCNPKHLRAGTHADNVADRVSSGRNAPQKGEKNPHAILTDEKVLAIRKEYIPRKVSMYKLATKYNISVQIVWQVIHKITWKHLP